MLYEMARRVERNLKWPVVAICAYESVVLTFPRWKYTPPVSVLFHKHKWAMIAFYGLLTAHVWFLED